jgi:2-dehydro-3-deoxy-D-gluconate 5-dehydrogenase
MILDQFKLTGKTALVTGACRGIGMAIAVALAEAGADIVGVSDKLGEPGSDVEKEVATRGRKFKGYRCDFSDRQSLYGFIGKVKAECAPIDILVNNAGIILRKPAAEHPDEFWDKVIEINLNAQFILAREFGKDMLQRGKGKICFTCSLLTFQGGILVPSYAASKAGVGALVKSLTNAWAAKGVNVNGIAPGYIATDNTAALRADPDRSAAILARIPAGRWGNAQDLATTVLFLCSPAADYIHGTIVTVDGGWMGR